MPMDKLDSIVIGEVTKRILQPDHLVALLDEYLRTAIEREGRNRDRFRQMRQDRKETEAGIARLLRLVEKGLMDAEDALMCERLVSLRFRRDELAEQIADLTRRLASAEPVITSKKIEPLALLLRDKLQNGPPDLCQAYARLLLSEVRATIGKSASAAPKPCWPGLRLVAWSRPHPQFTFLFENGAPERIRTSGLRFRKPSLYPAELRGHREMLVRKHRVRCKSQSIALRIRATAHRQR